MPETRSSKLECASCWENLTRWFFPDLPLAAGCEHKIDICIKCLQQWITISIDSQYQPRILCPHAGCDAKLEGEQDLKRHAKKSDWERVGERIPTINIGKLGAPQDRSAVGQTCEEDRLSRELIESMKREGNVVECGNCLCEIEREVVVRSFRCGKCLYEQKWDESKD